MSDHRKGKRLALRQLVQLGVVRTEILSASQEPPARGALAVFVVLQDALGRIARRLHLADPGTEICALVRREDAACEQEAVSVISVDLMLR